MSVNAWTAWPSLEALSRTGQSLPRRVLAMIIRAVAFGVVVWSAMAHRGLSGWQATVALVGVCCCAAIAWGVIRMTLAHRLWLSMGLLVLLTGLAFVGEEAGFHVPATILWCACVVVAVERTPLIAALAMSVPALTGFFLYNTGSITTKLISVGGLLLAGYVLRLDAEARGSALRLLAQERVARKAEGESAALAERGRIAREIHDVLAHSLSAQLVHLEAARLLIERGAPREQILERVVGARRMARDGLTETRQALSALRGEISPLEDYLRDLVSTTTSAEVTVAGDRRPLPAEASQAVRRVAQEALTNARKHAPGATIMVRLEYGEEDVTLDVKDSGGMPGELAGSGGGYGLRGMKERAELLGGTLAAGPNEEGFAVTLKVPV